jgi:dihydrofolate reductase
MISIVAAIGRNRELGKDNKLLWNIPDDLKHFKEVTSGHPIIMGRKTFESIGRLLPNRLNIIVTRHPFEVSEKLYGKGEYAIVNSIDDAIDQAKVAPGGEEVMIIGGGQIFTQALALTDRLYLTVVDADFDADTFFPEYGQFTKTISKEDKESDGYKYQFLVLEK